MMSWLMNQCHEHPTPLSPASPIIFLPLPHLCPQLLQPGSHVLLQLPLSPSSTPSVLLSSILLPSIPLPLHQMHYLHVPHAPPLVRTYLCSQLLQPRSHVLLQLAPQTFQHTIGVPKKSL